MLRNLWRAAVAVAFAVTPLPVWAQEEYAPVATGPHGPMLYGARLFLLALVGGLGFGVGAFFSPALKPFRRIVGFVLLAIILSFALFGPYPAADIFDAVAAIGIFFAAVGFGMALGRVAAQATRRAAQARQRPTSFGSAKWATFDYLKEHGLFGRDGYLLGTFGAPNPTALRYDGARHLLTVAPTRSGKGVSSIIPNLVLHEGSVFCIDPKGENARITASRRGAGDPKRNIPGLGQKIVLLDPWDSAASSLGLKQGRFNPLDWIRADDSDAGENALLLADALVIKEGHGEAAFWDEEAKALLTGIILYVAIAPEEAGNRNLGRVRDILTQGDHAMQETLLRMFEHEHPVIKSTASRTVSKEAKLRSSVFASAQAHTHFLDSGRIRDSLSQSDFAFEDLKTKALTVYLVLPADRLSTFNRWLRLLVQQAITVNARNITEKPVKPILFMLDEMAALGKLPSVEQAYGLMAGFGMQLWGVVQDLSQLAKIYGDNGWQTFISNSGVVQYFGSRDKMTAEYFSSLCGVTTIEVHSLSWMIGRALSFARSWSTSTASGSGGGSTSGGSQSTSDSVSITQGRNEAQRQLAYPDELMVLKGDRQIVFVENLDPIPAAKVVWHQDQALRPLGVDLHPPAALPDARQVQAQTPQPLAVVPAV